MEAGRREAKTLSTFPYGLNDRLKLYLSFGLHKKKMMRTKALVVSIAIVMMSDDLLNERLL
jgi:hypothetical protein